MHNLELVVGYTVKLALSAAGLQLPPFIRSNLTLGTDGRLILRCFHFMPRCQPPNPNPNHILTLTLSPTSAIPFPSPLNFSLKFAVVGACLHEEIEDKN